MKLTATLINPIALHKISLTLERLGATCLICFTPQAVRFIWYPEQKAGLRSWINVDPTSLFSQYRVASQDHNEVNLSVGLDSFTRATKAAQEAEETKIDLGQRVKDGHRDVLLIWRMKLRTRTGDIADTRHEISVDRFSSDRTRPLWEPPVLTDPHAYIVFPKLQHIKPIVDRMRSLCKYMTIAANMDGQVKLSVATEMTEVESVFSGLNNPQLEGHETAEDDKTLYASVEILTEDFANFLNCQNLDPSNIVCVVTEQASLAFYAYIDLDTYIPYKDHNHFLQRPETILTCHIPVYLP